MRHQKTTNKQINTMTTIYGLQDEASALSKRTLYSRCVKNQLQQREPPEITQRAATTKRQTQL